MFLAQCLAYKKYVIPTQILYLDIPVSLLTSILTDKTIPPLSFDEVRHEHSPDQWLVHNKEAINISFLDLCTDAAVGSHSLWVAHSSAHLASRSTDCLCSKLSFQEHLYHKQLWKREAVSAFGAKHRHICCSLEKI